VKYVMRQSRDGATEIVNLAPTKKDAGFVETLRNPPWIEALTWFMRTMAWVWMANGLYKWAVILGFWTRFGEFAMLPRMLQGSMTFFAAADLVASVGLWLAAPWGGALWLLCAGAEALMPVLGSRGSFINNYAAGVNVALILIYFVLKWRVSVAGR